MTGFTYSEVTNYKKIKKDIRKYNKKDYNFIDKIYISICNSDNFQGLIIPKNFEYIIKTIINYDKKYNIISVVFDDYEKYRDYEVECSRYTKHGSSGSEKLNTLDEILDYFSDRYGEKLNKKLLKLKIK